MLAGLFRTSPDSITETSGGGRSHNAHLLWSLWFFGDLIYGQTANRAWILTIVLGLPTLLLLWLLATRRPREQLGFYLSSMALLGYALLPWNHSGGTCSLIYACALMAFLGDLRRAIAMMVVILVVFVTEASSLQWPWSVILAMCAVMGSVCFGNLVQRIGMQKDAELRLSHDEVRRLAASAERERIGRDLHDLLGHTLSLIALKSELANKLFDRDPAAAKREMADVERVARDALAQVRSAVTGIRAAGLAAELASAKLLLASKGVHLDCAIADVGMPVDMETALAMTLREAVTNIERHARATQARVALDAEPNRVTLRVEDNGRGGIIVPGNGLAGMRERLTAIRAKLSVDSQRGRGTVLLVTAPLPQPEAEAKAVATLRGA